MNFKQYQGRVLKLTRNNFCSPRETYYLVQNVKDDGSADGLDLRTQKVEFLFLKSLDSDELNSYLTESSLEEFNAQIDSEIAELESKIDKLSAMKATAQTKIVVGKIMGIIKG
jgi:hypothetical protein